VGNATYHLLMAGSVVAILPCVLLFLVAQRYFVQSIITSGFKGV
jgi:ABC-type glycerol-3-phosphate transport system permease component